MIRQTIVAICAGLSLSGCISLLPDSGDLPPRLALDAGTRPAGQAAPKYAATLVIADPSAAAVYNSFLVAIATGPLEYGYLADAEWTDRVPVLIRRFLERRIGNEGMFRAVGDRGDIPLSDYTVQIDVRDFHLDDASSEETAIVTLGVRLIDRRGQILATTILSHRATPTSTRRGDRATALNAAAVQVADDMIDWLDAEIGLAGGA